MSKRPTDERLRTKMNEYAADLLDATYGHLKGILAKEGEIGEDGLPATVDPDKVPKADVFNAVVNWLRTESGMEPPVTEKSGIGKLAEELGRRSNGKRGNT